MHICVNNLTINGSDNDLSPGQCQAIIWTNAGILLIEPLGKNSSEIVIKIHTFSFKKMYLKKMFGKCRPFCLGLNVLKRVFSNFISGEWCQLVPWVCYLQGMFIIHDAKVIIFSLSMFICVCVSLSWCLSRQFNYEGLVSYKQYFGGMQMSISSGASYVLHPPDIIDDITRSKTRTNLKIACLI